MRGHASSAASRVAVVNQAAGGNRVLRDGKGPNVLARLDRDVLAQPGLAYVLVFEGVNDVGTAAPDPASQRDVEARLIQAYRQLIARLHALAVPVFAATITPFTGPDAARQPYSAAERERTRQNLNRWIRTSREFDAVVDFDAVLRDPHDAARLKPAYDSGRLPPPQRGSLPRHGRRLSAAPLPGV